MEEPSTHCRSPEPLLTISIDDLDKKEIQMAHHEILRSRGDLDKKEIQTTHPGRLRSRGDLDKLAIQMTHPGRLRSTTPLTMHHHSLKYNLFARNFLAQSYSPEASCKIVSAALDVLDHSASYRTTTNILIPSMTSLLNQKKSILRQAQRNQSVANMAACQIQYMNGVRSLKY
eukprot:5489135-Ditylum_brightwellii.AAC.1